MGLRSVDIAVQSKYSIMLVEQVTHKFLPVKFDSQSVCVVICMDMKHNGQH